MTDEEAIDKMFDECHSTLWGRSFDLFQSRVEARGWLLAQLERVRRIKEAG